MTSTKLYGIKIAGQPNLVEKGYGQEVMILLCNLKAEMARRSVSILDIAKEIGRTDRSVREKIRGRTQFSVPEATAIRDKFFSGFSLEYLFTNERADDQGA